jgi:hypothetical protein
MAGKNTKAQKKGKHAAKPASKSSHGELAEKELDKVTGGSPRDPQSGLPTGQ